MKLFSSQAVFEVFAGVSINITSGWLGILVVVPGFFGVSSVEEYQKLLTINLPLAIVGLFTSFLITERKNKYV